ncbi:MAG: hypothetical protein GC151_08150 [Betaproteobacteria bacterium]|nr:hypothetical protein [Betaproteobacteria bacterium]
MPESRVRTSPATSRPPAVASDDRPSGRLAALIPAAALVAIAGLVTLVATTLWNSRNAYLDAAQVTARNLVRVLEAQTAQNVSAIGATLDGIVTVWSVVPGPVRLQGRALHDLLCTKARSNATVRSLYILDAEGVMRYHSEEWPARPLSFPDREYFRIQKTHDAGLFISAMMKGRITGRWDMVMSRRLTGPDGTFEGVVVAVLEPDKLADAYQGLQVGPHGLINLRHVDGDLIVRVPPLEGAIGRRIASTGPMLESIRKNGEAAGEITSSLDDISRFGVARVVANTPLLVFVGLSTEDTLSAWYSHALRYAAVTLVFCAAVVWLTVRLTREFRRREALLVTLAAKEALVREHRDHLQELVDERTRDLRVAKEAAEAANVAKSQFLANISHELRTPMHAILSFAQLGRQKAEAPEDAALPRIAQYFERIQQSGHRLLALLNDLLDLAKMEADRMTYDIAPHDVAAITAEVVSEFSVLARDRGVGLLLEPAANPCIAACDVTRIGQVVRNLVSNAVKFTPAGASVRVTCDAPPDGDAGVPAGTAVRVSVSDQGPGIPDDELESVFDKFVQSSSTTDGTGGTGLGLSICREIVSFHGGHIWAENLARGGTCVTFVLPAAGAPRASSRAPEASSHDPGRRRRGS